MAGGLKNPAGVGMTRQSPWEAPYRPLAPISSYALAASRHMHLYGTTREFLLHFGLGSLACALIITKW